MKLQRKIMLATTQLKTLVMPATPSRKTVIPNVVSSVGYSLPVWPDLVKRLLLGSCQNYFKHTSFKKDLKSCLLWSNFFRREPNFWKVRPAASSTFKSFKLVVIQLARLRLVKFLDHRDHSLIMINNKWSPH